MGINFEEEYCTIVFDGINIQIDREMILDIAKKAQDFYEDGFESEEDDNLGGFEWYHRKDI